MDSNFDLNTRPDDNDQLARSNESEVQEIDWKAKLQELPQELIYKSV